MNEAINQFLTQSSYESSALQVAKLVMPFDINARNLEISKVYNQITKDVRYFLSRLAHPEARTYLVGYYPIEEQSKHRIVFEFLCIMCEITLSIKEDHRLIEVNTDTEIKRWVGAYNYEQMLRQIYRTTMWEATQYNIEDCLVINTEKIDHYDYWVKRLHEGETLDTSIFIEDLTTGIEDLLI